MTEALPQQTEVAATAAPGARVRAWWQRWWWVLALAALAVAIGVLNMRDETNQLDLDTMNPYDNGGMAVAEVLRSQGVTVTATTSLSDALDLVAAADSTLLVLDWADMSDDDRAALSQAQADVVLAGDPYADLAGITDAVEPTVVGSSSPVLAQCDDPDAAAASRIGSVIGGVRATGEGVSTCFPTAEDSYAMATWTQNGHTWRYIADMNLATNAQVDQHGNAALVLRSLGAHSSLVWLRYEPDPFAGRVSTLPPWGGPVLAMLLLAGLAAAFWQGRHMGRVVTEPLPVVVLPGETVRGRARLYRRAKATAHAAAALRAGSAVRIATLLGLPRTAAPVDLVAAASAAARRPPDQVGALLYGTAPRTEKELSELARALAQLEEEVHL